MDQTSLAIAHSWQPLTCPNLQESLAEWPFLALHTFFLSTASRDANYILKEKLGKSPHPSTTGCVVRILAVASQCFALIRLRASVRDK
jgi:hypothetical protein